MPVGATNGDRLASAAGLRVSGTRPGVGEGLTGVVAVAEGAGEVEMLVGRNVLNLPTALVFVALQLEFKAEDDEFVQLRD